MKKFCMLFLTLFWPCIVWSAPECYKNAEYPAHDFPFVDKEYFEAVSIDPADENKCLPPIAIFRGEPLFRQPLYASMGNVYSSYIKGMSDRETLRRLVAYLRPAPRTFRQWMELYTSPVMPPDSLGGLKSMEKLLEILSPGYKRVEDFLYGIEHASLRIDHAWPTLFLFMDGDILPQNESVPFGKDRLGVAELALKGMLEWRFPNYSMYSKSGLFVFEAGAGE